MQALHRTVRELLAFFVDDGRLALLVLGWLALLWLAIGRLRLPAPWDALLLFAGLAGILAASAVRRSRAG
ncbi:MAG TPA: hypothetical protein VHY19_05375 [Steroidobacteraceae bacterium]|jgi:hypothetical protein|nr:hypothetical protein [Steroidobacteraceae bacterium]